MLPPSSPGQFQRRLLTRGYVWTKTILGWCAPHRVSDRNTPFLLAKPCCRQPLSPLPTRFRPLIAARRPPIHCPTPPCNNVGAPPSRNHHPRRLVSPTGRWPPNPPFRRRYRPEALLSDEPLPRPLRDRVTTAPSPHLPQLSPFGRRPPNPPFRRPSVPRRFCPSDASHATFGTAPPRPLCPERPLPQPPAVVARVASDLSCKRSTHKKGWSRSLSCTGP